MDELLGAIDRLSQQLRDAGFEEVSYEEELEVPASAAAAPHTPAHAHAPDPAHAPVPVPVPCASYYVPGGWWVFLQEPLAPAHRPPQQQQPPPPQHQEQHQHQHQHQQRLGAVDAVTLLARENAELREEIARLQAPQITGHHTATRGYAPPQAGPHPADP